MKGGAEIKSLRFQTNSSDKFLSGVFQLGEEIYEHLTGKFSFVRCKLIHLTNGWSQRFKYQNPFIKMFSIFYVHGSTLNY